MYTHSKQIITAGAPIAQARGALVMLHGRGASAQDIISLSRSLNVSQMAIYAPQATNSSWYPYSFMVPQDQNQPALDSALAVIGELVDDILSAGIPADKIYFAGFSQGACLTLEFIARHAQQYGGAVAFTGGLIGKELETGNYKGDFNNTPVLITTGDPDPHVPVSRVQQSVETLKAMGADVTSKVYPGRPHTILADEIKLANQYIFK
ncbi:alpha/beta hydrolase [Mucilaginibacter paludis]|uniref:Phospholipase/Carboxylesterase n=1 Tax=Mucilaginibacter paludis DSM 18603 TaxID=714943 RepID=H1YFN3_9SPHI|nr:dienelactone hydrolase family protein [Mucilaginibacter paludis]EHQ24435.1 phospholipase/Carboxylesterase [Mucilaginibacter paludis DSM 18603]